MANLGAMEDDDGEVLDPISSMNYTANTHFVDSVPIDPEYDRRRDKTLIVDNEEIQQKHPKCHQGKRATAKI